MSVEKWGWVSVAATGSVAVALGSFLFAYANGLDSGQNQAVAAWVQAIGSVAAIIGAVWIASEQHRRDVERRELEEKNASYLLRAELAWLSGDVVQFLNPFLAIEPLVLTGKFEIGEEDLSDLLDRLTWCRQRVEHKGQLGMLGVLRESLVGTARLVRSKNESPIAFSDEDVTKIREWRDEALGVYHHANGVVDIQRYRS